MLHAKKNTGQRDGRRGKGITQRSDHCLPEEKNNRRYKIGL